MYCLLLAELKSCDIVFSDPVSGWRDTVSPPVRGGSSGIHLSGSAIICNSIPCVGNNSLWINGRFEVEVVAKLTMLDDHILESKPEKFTILSSSESILFFIYIFVYCIGWIHFILLLLK